MSWWRSWKARAIFRPSPISPVARPPNSKKPARPKKSFSGGMMRHRVAGYKLGRNTSQRLALRRNLVTELFRHERIHTTEAKAKSMRDEAEHLITVAKRGLAAGGAASVHAHRLAARVI